MSQIEKLFGITLGHDTASARKATEYEQFEATLRSEAARMSEFYEVFYCLENSIRKLVADVLVEAEGADWWNGKRVDEKRIREPANARQKKEIDSGIGPRSKLSWLETLLTAVFDWKIGSNSSQLSVIS